MFDRRADSISKAIIGILKVNTVNRYRGLRPFILFKGDIVLVGNINISKHVMVGPIVGMYLLKYILIFVLFNTWVVGTGLVLKF